MKKCLKVVLVGDFPSDLLSNRLSLSAKEIGLEGSAQIVSKREIRIIICGTADQLDDFLDVVYSRSLESYLEDITVDPFLKDKDYRGVFRIIE